jgi:hypothetical protein
MKHTDMKQHHLYLALVAAVAGAITISAPIGFAQGVPGGSRGTQERKAPAPTIRTIENAAPYTPKKLSDGQPDISGDWSNATYTPLERSADLKDKPFFTREEAFAFAQRRLQGLYDQAPDNIHYDNAIWQSEKEPRGLTSLRTSLVVDPPDGRIPPVLPEAKRRSDAAAAARRGFDPTDYRSRGITERCFTSVNLTWPHNGAPLLPEGYNSNLQIVQGPGYVVIEPEMVHDARVIPLDGRPHAGSGLRQWIGDSRGHWDGNTLVIDNTNFNDKTPFRGSTDALKVTERITPIDKDTLLYRATIEDPHTWARPWTLEYPIVRSDEPIYEYACHEGNYGVANILRAAAKE